jgi:hypothetical protein
MSCLGDRAVWEYTKHAGQQSYYAVTLPSKFTMKFGDMTDMVATVDWSGTQITLNFKLREEGK